MATINFNPATTSYTGSNSSDTLLFNITNADLSSTTLSSIEILKAGLSTGTTFLVDDADLAANGSVLGNSSSSADTLSIVGTQLDLSATKLTSIETLKAHSSLATTFIVDQADLAKGGAVTGNKGNDTLVAHGSSLDLTFTTLSSIEILKADSGKATTFILDGADLASIHSIVGNLGTTVSDTLVITDPNTDLSGISLNSIEVLKAGTASMTDFTLDDLSGLKSILGTAKVDSLTINDAAFDLSGTTLSGIETLKAGLTVATTFTLDQADLVKNGEIDGTAKDDTIAGAGTSLDLTSTTLSSIEILKAGATTPTKFTITDTQLTAITEIDGTATTTTGHDTLIVKGSNIDLTGTTLSSIDVLSAAGTAAATFHLDAADLTDLQSITGLTGKNDVLIVAGTTFDLSGTALSSVEILQTGSTSATDFKLNQNDLATGGSILGSTSTGDTVIAAGSVLDLSNTKLTGIEAIKSSFTGGTAFVLNQDEFNTFNSKLTGSTGTDALFVKTSNFDITSSGFSSIEILRAGLATATTFTVGLSDLKSGGGQILGIGGNSGKDTLLISGTTDFNLSSVGLSSIEVLKADPANGTLGTTFTLESNDMVFGNSVIGSTSATDTITLDKGQLNLSGTKLVSIENLTIGAAGGIVILSQKQFDTLPPTGGKGEDGLALASAVLDLTSSTLSSIEDLYAIQVATTFKVDAADLVSGGGVFGNSFVDTLIIKGTAFDLSSTTTASVEKLVADSANGITPTVFTVNQADLATGGSVIGGKGIDVLKTMSATLDLSSTGLTSIETLVAGTTNATSFTLDQADLASNGTIIGVAGKNDTLFSHGTSLNLTSTTLSSIEILTAASSKGTTFTLDKADVDALSTINGSTSGVDTLIVNDTAFDLSSKTLFSIEILKAGASGATTFTLDQADVAALGTTGQIIGGKGIDVLQSTGNILDLSSTTLSSIEVLQATQKNTEFDLDQADLVKFINGSSGTQDFIAATGTLLDLTSTTLSSIEWLISHSTNGTTFKVDQADLGDFVSGAESTDVLMIHGTSMDLTHTSLTSIGTITTDSASAATFTVDQDDLDSVGTVAGGKGIDTLQLGGTGTILDLTGTTISSIEHLGTATGKATEFILDADDLTALGKAGTITGSTLGGDTLTVHDPVMDLTTIKLTGIENLKADGAGSTILLDQADIAALGTTGAISGNGSTLEIHGTALDLTSTTLSGISILTTDSAKATTFTVDQADLAHSGSIIGSTASGDVLIAHGASLDLTSTTLSGIEVLKAGITQDTTFTLDNGDLANLTSVVGNIGTSAEDTLHVVNTASDTIDLSKISLTGIESITTDTKDGHALVTVGGGVGGVELDLKAGNTETDTISFTDAYKVTAVTDAGIAAHTLTIKNFESGVGGDLIDLSDLAHGTPTASTDVTEDIAGAATLKAALNIAAAENGSATSHVVTFDFGGDTYVLVDNSASKTLSADDAVIKLIGTHTLTDNFVFPS